MMVTRDKICQCELCGRTYDGSERTKYCYPCLLLKRKNAYKVAALKFKQSKIDSTYK